MGETGVKLDGGKIRPTLLPIDAIEGVVKVLEFGAQKYTEHGWREVPDARRRYTDAAMRHMFSHIKGEWVDEESGLLHLAHATCSLLFALQLELQKREQNEI